MRNWWYWNKDLVLLGVILSVLGIICVYATIKVKEEERAKFNMCMSDIHNVYICETWARGKDVAVYYIPQ